MPLLGAGLGKGRGKIFFFFLFLGFLGGHPFFFLFTPPPIFFLPPGGGGGVNRGCRKPPFAIACLRPHRLRPFGGILWASPPKPCVTVWIDGDVKAVITRLGQVSRGTSVALKPAVDQALAGDACPLWDHVLGAVAPPRQPRR